MRGPAGHAVTAWCERGLIWFNRYNQSYSSGCYEFTRRAAPHP